MALSENVLMQECRNSIVPGSAWDYIFFTLAPNICLSSIQLSLIVSFGASVFELAYRFLANLYTRKSLYIFVSIIIILVYWNSSRTGLKLCSGDGRKINSVSVIQAKRRAANTGKSR